MPISMKRETLRKLVQIVFFAIAKIEFVGGENIPAPGGIILATNHITGWIFPCFFKPDRPDITALVTDKYQKYAFFRWFTETAEGIWIDRSKADFAAFRLAAEVIQSGRALGIAPEGTRSDTASLLEAKEGTALLAVRTNTPVRRWRLLGPRTRSASSNACAGRIW